MDISIYDGGDEGDVDVQYHTLDNEKSSMIRCLRCNICEKQMNIGVDVTVTKCEHVYHLECLNQWFIRV